MGRHVDRSNGRHGILSPDYSGRSGDFPFLVVDGVRETAAVEQKGHRDHDHAARSSILHQSVVAQSFKRSLFPRAAEVCATSGGTRLKRFVGHHLLTV